MKNHFDTREPIVGGGTVKASFGPKTVPVLHVGTRLRCENRSGDGRPDSVGTVRGYVYKDPDDCGHVLPSYRIAIDGEAEPWFVAIEDVAAPPPGGYWTVLST